MAFYYEARRPAGIFLYSKYQLIIQISGQLYTKEAFRFRAFHTCQ